MIPQEKRAAVTRGLREGFGVSEFEDIRMIKDLASSMVFRIVVRGSPFLLKISLRTSDPARHYACMKTAAEAGLAPRVWYSSVEDRVSIEDYVETAPLPVADALSRIPATLRKLHALPPFRPVPHGLNTSCTFLLDKGPALDGLLQKIQASNTSPKSEREELLARYAELSAAYSQQDGDLVSSHNDLFKPDNMLFDGHRVWLVDWEAAFLNDRYADLAVVANLVVTNQAEENIYLREYFGAPPDECQRARFFLMQQLAHVFYAMAFLLLGSAGNPVDWSESLPGFENFHRKFWAGDITLDGTHTKAIYGRIHLQRLFENAQSTRWNETFRVLSDRRPIR